MVTNYDNNKYSPNNPTTSDKALVSSKQLPENPPEQYSGPTSYGQSKPVVRKYNQEKKSPVSALAIPLL